MLVTCKKNLQRNKVACYIKNLDMRKFCRKFSECYLDFFEEFDQNMLDVATVVN